MRFKLSPELCYISGLAGRSGESERSAVGIRTQSDEIEERFIKYAMALGVDSKKILIEEQGSFKHIYFYHSKLARMIREILKDKTRLARNRALAAEFLAGTFDSSGHIRGGTVTIGRLDKGDELLLELLGIHTASFKVLNIKQFMELISSASILLNARLQAPPKGAA